MIVESSSKPASEYSDDFKRFLKSVLDAEADLPEDVSSPTEATADRAEDEDPSTPGQLGRDNMRDHNDLKSPGVPHTLSKEASMTSHPRPPVIRTEVVPPLPDSPSFDCDDSPGETLAHDPSLLVPAAGRPSLPSKMPSDVSVNSAAQMVPRPLFQMKRKPVQHASNPDLRKSGETSLGSDHVPKITEETFPVSKRPPTPEALLGTSQNSPAPARTPPIPPRAERSHTAASKAQASQSASYSSAIEFQAFDFKQATPSPYDDEPPAYFSQHPEAQRDVQDSPEPMSPLIPDIKSPQIIRLVRDDNLDGLQNWLRDEVAADEAEPQTGRTALMEAARLGSYDACKMLLQARFKVTTEDVNGNTALHFGAEAGDARICQSLVHSGSDPERMNRERVTPLVIAIRGRRSEVTSLFVNGLAERKANDGPTLNAWHEAVKIGDLVTAQTLVHKGLIKPKKIKDAWKPAEYAAESGNLLMLEFVVENKCSLKERSPDGATPLHAAARRGHAQMAERLLSLNVSWSTRIKKTEETALHVAAALGHTSTAIALLAYRGANVAVADADNSEPVLLATRRGDFALVKALLNKGAKLRSYNKFGWNPMLLASAYGYSDLVGEFITRGISAEDKLMTPSFKPEKRTNEAARRKYTCEVRFPHSGARALHLAAEFGHDEAARILINAGADLTATDSRGWTPLHHAAFACRVQTVKLLLAKGAAVDAKTVDGNTAPALGHRAYGLEASEDDRYLVSDMLENALKNCKKSRLPDLSRFLSAGAVGNKTAMQRNQVWYKAELAEKLSSTGRGGEDDASSSHGSSSVLG